MKPLRSVLLLALLVTLASSAAARPVPTWDKQIKGPTRFQVLKTFAGAAVLDKETGLVWEKSPTSDTFTWPFAVIHCASLSVGGRAGWRLPGITEVMSLVDPSVPTPGVTLPDGNPFTNVVTESTIAQAQRIARAGPSKLAKKPSPAVFTSLPRQRTS